MSFRFIEAKNYTRVTGTPRKIRFICLHTMETGERPRIAEDIALWLAGQDKRDPDPRKSVHYLVDDREIVQGVRDEDVAWHAPGLNHNSIGIEIAGKANQTREQWADGFSTRMLELAAALVAEKCSHYDLDIQEVGSTGLLGIGRRLTQPLLTGITTHAAGTRAFQKSTHTDPGLGFPMDLFVQMVQKRARG